MASLRSQESLFTFNGNPIVGIDISDKHIKCKYLTNLNCTQPQQQADRLPAIFTTEELLSDHTIDKIFQRIKADSLDQLTLESTTVFNDEVNKLKAQLWKFVLALEEYQSHRPEYFNCLLERYSRICETTLEQKFSDLKKLRDTILNDGVFPREADEALERYLEDFLSLRSVDFKTQTQELTKNLLTPFTMMKQETNKIGIVLNKLHQRVRQ